MKLEVKTFYSQLTQTIRIMSNKTKNQLIQGVKEVNNRNAFKLRDIQQENIDLKKLPQIKEKGFTHLTETTDDVLCF